MTGDSDDSFEDVTYPPVETLPPADVEAALCFYACGMVGMMLAGLENKHLDEELLADQMLRLLSGEISLRPADAGADGTK